MIKRLKRSNNKSLFPLVTHVEFRMWLWSQSFLNSNEHEGNEIFITASQLEIICIFSAKTVCALHCIVIHSSSCKHRNICVRIITQTQGLCTWCVNKIFMIEYTAFTEPFSLSTNTSPEKKEKHNAIDTKRKNTHNYSSFLFCLESSVQLLKKIHCTQWMNNRMLQNVMMNRTYRLFSNYKYSLYSKTDTGR